MYLEGLWLYTQEKETSSAVGQNFSMTHSTSVNLGGRSQGGGVSQCLHTGFTIVHPPRFDGENTRVVVNIIIFKYGKCSSILQGLLRVEPFWAKAIL